MDRWSRFLACAHPATRAGLLVMFALVLEIRRALMFECLVLLGHSAVSLGHLLYGGRWHASASVLFRSLDSIRAVSILARSCFPPEVVSALGAEETIRRGNPNSECLRLSLHVVHKESACCTRVEIHVTADFASHVFFGAFLRRGQRTVTDDRVAPTSQAGEDIEQEAELAKPLRCLATLMGSCSGSFSSAARLGHGF